MNSRTLHRPALRWPYRLVAIALAALFLATGAVDAYGLHRCPHHDGLPATAAATANTGHDHESQHVSAPSHAGEDGGHDPCTCVGVCGATSAGLPRAAEPVLRVEGTEHTAAAIVPDRVAPSLDRDYLQPFANAPPSTR